MQTSRINEKIVIVRKINDVVCLYDYSIIVKKKSPGPVGTSSSG
jgi:hypothetical protein